MSAQPAQPPALPARLWIALVCFFRVLTDKEFALLVDEARILGALRAPEPRPRPVTFELAPVPAPVAPVAAAKAPAAPAAPATTNAPASPAAPAVAGARAAAVPPTAAAAPSAAPPGATASEGSLHLLALLQREARLLDFCEEELTGYTDATIGAAARTVHAGCRTVLQRYFTLQPVRAEKEGVTVKLEAGFDARALRLTGNVVGHPPFSGALRHHGWRAAELKLPEPVRGEAAAILAPAEIELP